MFLLQIVYIKKGINGVKQSLNYMEKNYSIALMVDQRLSEGAKVPFFNELASTTSLPAQLAIKFKCDIIPIYISWVTIFEASPWKNGVKNESIKYWVNITAKHVPTITTLSRSNPGRRDSIITLRQRKDQCVLISA